jgi:hypothetical protein
MKKHQVSIIDIAKELGISKSTGVKSIVRAPQCNGENKDRCSRTCGEARLPA